MIMKAFFFSKKRFRKQNVKKKTYCFEGKENQKMRSGKNLVFFCEKETKIKEMIFLRSSKNNYVSRLVLRLQKK